MLWRRLMGWSWKLKFDATKPTFSGSSSGDIQRFGTANQKKAYLCP
jgi:hypothetical protein